MLDVCPSVPVAVYLDDDEDDDNNVVDGDDGGYGNYGRINFMLYLYAYHF